MHDGIISWEIEVSPELVIVAMMHTRIRLEPTRIVQGTYVCWGPHVTCRL
jgi:hypothetical protein